MQGISSSATAYHRIYSQALVNLVPVLPLPPSEAFRESGEHKLHPRFVLFLVFGLKSKVDTFCLLEAQGGYMPPPSPLKTF